MRFEEKCTGLRAGMLALALVLAGCEEANTYVEPPPPKVTIAQPLVQEVTDYLEFTGTTVASERVELRARVSGVLQSMHFEPGTDVQQGDLLFVIDPKEYEANLQADEAELAAAKAEFKRANTELARAQKLYKKKAGSEAEVVKWQGEQGVANAAIQRALAKVDRAKLDLSYTQITAPISGRVGRNRVDIGNLVGEGEATVLTEITVFDPMFVYFNLNERDLLRVIELYRQRINEKGLDPSEDVDRKTEIILELGLSSEEGYPHRGLYDFAESGVDSGTGTLELRGIFKNKEKPVRLLPGLFARVRMPIATRANMPLVTERAIGADQSGLYALIVNSEGVVEKRNIRIGQLIDGMRVIEEGVQSDDWMVVNGIQRARPGGKVDPEKTEMTSLSASAMQKAAEMAKVQSGASASEAPESGETTQ